MQPIKKQYKPQFVNAKTGLPCTGGATNENAQLIARLEELADRIEDLLEELEGGEYTEGDTDVSDEETDFPPDRLETR